ncbi:MAG TPA: DNA primase [Frankiaceae bacterium]|nr:DNA primase [Frankiaceae bacterium]
MAGRISDASLNAVREAASIVDVVSAVVALRPAGSDRQIGLCPFHDEKRPSFGIAPSSNVFHCFGCGEGGDVITFVRKLDGLTFTEAVEQLAGRFNVALTYEGGGQVANRETGKRQRLSEALQAAAEFYAEQLARPDARVGRDFLSQRGFDRAAAEHFGVGFAPGGWDTLAKHLRGRGFSTEELVDAGLAKIGSRGTPTDRFHRRLVWPIRETTGGVVGFGARRLFDDDPITAKYLNTPETILFKKSHLLYGADLARKAIAARSQAVVVEGYTDVMACHLSGVETAVATCGTAFGEEHVKLLRRLLNDQDESRGEVVFTFDGDQAGQNAARKAMQFDQRFVVQTFVAIEDEGRDPCELRQAAGDVAVRELVASRVPLVDFALRATVEPFDLDSAEGRSGALRVAVPLLAGIKDRVVRDQYVRRVSGWLGFESPEPVQAAVHERLGEAAPAPGQRQAPRPRDRRVDDAAVTAEREALKAALQRPGLAGPAFDGLEPLHFTSPLHRELFGAMVQAGGVCSATDVSSWIARVSTVVESDEGRQLVPALAVEPLRWEGDGEEYYVASVVDRVQELHTSRRIRDVKARMERTNPVTDQEVHLRLFGELISLEERKRQLRDRSLGPA